MGFQALITFDLPGASNEKRDIFYKYLKEKDWVRIEQLTTSWEATFKENIPRLECIETLEAELKSAKEISNIRKVEYAIQLSLNAVIIKTI